MPPTAASMTINSKINTTNKKVDWRHYDYSDGPPKPSSSINTRDTNPYSKHFDNTSFNSHPSLPNKVKPFDRVQTTTITSSTDSDGIRGSSVTFSDGSNPVLRVDTTSTNTTTTLNNSNNNGSALTYRPAKHNVTPPSPIDFVNEADEEDEIMRLPKVKKYAENLSKKKRDDEYNDDDETSPFDQPKVPIITPQHYNVVNGDKRGFEEVWKDADDELDQESAIHAQPIVSDDEEPDIVVPDAANTDDVGEEYNYEKEIDNNDYYEENESGNNNIQFDDFTGDRSKASTTNHNNDFACSDDSVGKMELTMGVAPVCILKTSGRFDSFVTKSSGSVNSNHSSISRRMSIERSLTSQGVDDQMTFDDSATQDIDATPKRNLERRRSLEMNNREDDKTVDTIDEDSIFDFKKTDLKGAKNFMYTQMSKINGENDDDDTSIDDIETTSSPKRRADTLRDRTKQAWSARNRATVATATRSEINGKQGSVKFGKTDTIREFIPEESSSSEEESDEDDETTYTEYTEMDEDDDTFAGRSMHSFYTKSHESETEDMIKDFFLIGRGDATNPGRRQLRYKKGKKEEYEKMKKKKNQAQDESSSVISDPNSFSALKPQEDSVAMLYNFCEDGVKAMLRYCGLSSTTPDYADEEPLTPDDWVKKWYKIIFHADYSAEPSNVCGAFSVGPSIETMVEPIHKMALNSARIRHRLKGLNYDVTQSMTLMNEVHFVPLFVKIPLGVGFEESEYGCAVQKLFSNGNALNCASGDKVEIGDHLASINGSSVFKKSVIEVCKILACCDSKDDIHLVFIRYIGPIRNSNAIEQQGYEVIDPLVEKSKQTPKEEKRTSRDPTSKAGGSMSPVKLAKSVTSTKTGGSMSPVKLAKSLASKAGGSMSPVKLAKSLSRMGSNKIKKDVGIDTIHGDVQQQGAAITGNDNTATAIERKTSQESKKKKRFFPLFKKRRNQNKA